MDARHLALIPFFGHEKSRKEMLRDICHFINEINISEEFKYLIKFCQILSVRALFTDDEQKEYLGVIKMGSTYIDNYEKNLIQNATKKANKRIAKKMKELGADAEFILACTGNKL